MIAIDHGFLMHSPGPERGGKKHSELEHSLQRRAPDEGVEKSFSLGFQYIPQDIRKIALKI